MSVLQRKVESTTSNHAIRHKEFHHRKLPKKVRAQELAIHCDTCTRISKFK